MSSCLSGGGRAYGFDLEIVKSSSTSSRTSHSSSPSSTISEASNSPLAISTRKPRTPRKRPNQIYNEAAALLSTAYPKIFSTKHLTKPCKFTKPYDYFFDASSELVLPFRAIDNSSFLIQQQIAIPEKPSSQFEPKAVNSYEKVCQSPVESGFQLNNSLSDLCDGYQDDFDAESMLDEEIEEGIDSIMGNLCVDKEENSSSSYASQFGHCFGHPLGLGFGGKFEFGSGMRRGGVWPLRNVDQGDWWKFPTVDVHAISPKFSKVAVVDKKKKKKKVENKLDLKPQEIVPRHNLTVPKSPKEDSIPKPNPGLLLKLNFDEVMKTWSDRGSPFSEEMSGSDEPGNDVHARLAQIDLFSENGGLREASVLRYKEKRRTRLFSKKIRYQVRKVNADRRPRMKGRFVRRPNSPMSEEG